MQFLALPTGYASAAADYQRTGGQLSAAERATLARTRRNLLLGCAAGAALGAMIWPKIGRTVFPTAPWLESYGHTLMGGTLGALTGYLLLRPYVYKNCVTALLPVDSDFGGVIRRVAAVRNPDWLQAYAPAQPVKAGGGSPSAAVRT